MTALEILRWISSVILYFQVHFLQSMLLLDSQLCHSTGCYSIPVSRGFPLGWLVWPDEPCHLELSDPRGWLFKRWTPQMPQPVMSVSVPSPCLPPSQFNVNVDGCPYIETVKALYCNAPYFFPFFFIFSVIFQPVLLCVGYNNILV